MNNEPVAWINREDGSSVLDWDKDPYAQEHIPLYTHPVKDLTDAEILELSDKHLVLVNEYIGCGDYVSNIDGEIEFARAILRKAQEK
jgi:hypothetical protein